MERKDLILLGLLVFVFLLFYFLPYNSGWFNISVIGGLNLLNDYAKRHVLTCLVLAFFIAGAIATFVKKDSVIKYLGGKAKKHVSYAPMP